MECQVNKNLNTLSLNVKCETENDELCAFFSKFIENIFLENGMFWLYFYIFTSFNLYFFLLINSYKLYIIHIYLLEINSNNFKIFKSLHQIG